MSEAGNKGLFFKSAVYRRNRLIDAARLMPFLGAFLFVMPAFLSGTGAETARQWMYLFMAWLAMIILAAFMSRALKRSARDVEAED